VCSGYAFTSWTIAVSPVQTSAFAPVIGTLLECAERGGLVLGICTDVQILLKASMLPEAMLRNASLEFRLPGFHVLPY
jgi:phosphoribosylformylglycinamidine (FGAM) synthase-like amidotransferase family enzyme